MSESISEKTPSPSSMPTNRSPISSGVNPLFIAIVISITALVCAALIWRWTNLFNGNDPIIIVNALTPARIMEFNGNPAQVTIGLYIKSFQKFDMIKNDFIFDGVLWFEFDPSIISLATVSKISFERAEILYKSDPYTQLHDGKVFARYDIRIKFSAELSYAYFPVDDHRIGITLTHRNLTPSDAVFKSNPRDFIIEPDLSRFGWHRVGKNVETGYIETKLDPTDTKKSIAYPAATFTIDYARLGSMRNSISIILPLLILFFLSLFSLILDPVKSWSSIVSIAIQSITGLMAFRFVMEAISPTVGYFMYSDYFFFLFLSTSFVMFFMGIFGSHLSLRWKKTIIIILNVITVSVMFYLLYI